MHEKYLMVSYRAVQVKTWGFKIGQKPTCYRNTGETFI